MCHCNGDRYGSMAPDHPELTLELTLTNHETIGRNTLNCTGIIPTFPQSYSWKKPQLSQINHCLSKVHDSGKGAPAQAWKTYQTFPGPCQRANVKFNPAAFTFQRTTTNESQSSKRGGGRAGAF